MSAQDVDTDEELRRRVLERVLLGPSLDPVCGMRHALGMIFREGSSVSAVTEAWQIVVETPRSLLPHEVEAVERNAPVGFRMVYRVSYGSDRR